MAGLRGCTYLAAKALACTDISALTSGILFATGKGDAEESGGFIWWFNE